MGYKENLIKIRAKNSIEHQWNYFQRVYCWSYLNIDSYSKVRVKSFQKSISNFLIFSMNIYHKIIAGFQKKNS